MSFFRDPIRSAVIFKLRPTFDLRAPRDAHRYQRALETRRRMPRRSFDVPRLDDPAYLAPIN